MINKCFNSDAKTKTLTLCKFKSVSPKNIPCINLAFHVIKTAIISIGDNGF